MSRRFKAARISANLRKTKANENVSVVARQSAVSESAGNNSDTLIKRMETKTTNERNKMNPQKRAMYITKATQAGQVNQFNHSSVFLLAAIMALTDRVGVLEGKAGIVPDDTAPSQTVDEKAQADKVAAQASQAAADKAAADKAAADKAAADKAAADAATAQAASVSAAMPL